MLAAGGNGVNEARPGAEPSRTDDVLPAGAMTWSARMRQHATNAPEGTALIWAREDGGEEALTWAEIETQSNQLAWYLGEKGVSDTTLVGIALGNVPANVLLAIATWKLGGCALPLNPELPPHEREQMLTAMVASERDCVVVGRWQTPTVRVVPLPAELASFPATPHPDRIPRPGKSVGTGGSTGRSKIIIDLAPWVRVPGRAGTIMANVGAWREGMFQLTTTRRSEESRGG